MKQLKYFLIGFKNAFTENINEMRKECLINDLWEKSNKINEKFRNINERTKENIGEHIYSFY